jgi:hypothetical protein
MPSNHPLSITITANDGTNHIYISGDTSLNVLTLTLTNTTNADLVFQQCNTTNAWIGALPASYSGVYLLFNGLLSNTAIAGITVNAPGWTVYNYSDNQCGNYLVFAPQSSITLAANESVSFSLQLPAISGSANSGYLSCQYVNVLTDTPTNGGEQLYVMTVYPPHEDGSAVAQLPIQFEFIGDNIVYNNGYSNYLSFRITNTSAQALVSGGTASWGSSPPQFKLKFVQDNNYATGSLLTNSQASSLNISSLQLYGNKLAITKDDESYPVIWIIDEDETLSGTDGTILGTGTAASVSFAIESLQTYAQPSVTMAILEYSGFPGYEDGQVTAELQIKNQPPPDPIINQFYSGSSIINIKNTGTSVPIYFKVSNANAVRLYQGTSTISSMNSPNPNTTYQSGAYISQTTVFVLVVSNSAGKEVSATITVQVDTVPIGVIMMWSGALSTIPANWVVCDGTNGTPDLRERFVMGSSGDSASVQIPNPHNGTLHYLGGIGGITLHSHSVTTYEHSGSSTDNGGTHQHYMDFDGNRGVDDTGNGSSNNTYFHGGNSGSHDTWWYTETDLSQYDGSHSHTITIPGLTGTTSAIDTTPPYFVLYFIMKYG